MYWKLRRVKMYQVNQRCLHKQTLKLKYLRSEAWNSSVDYCHNLNKR